MPAWSIAQVALQGTGHARAGVPCQDKTAFLVKNHVHVICLADGAGSARLSHFGAEAVVNEMVRYVADNFDGLYTCDSEIRAGHIAETCRDILAELSFNLSCEARDLSSTLLLVAVKRNRFVAVHIGDGVIGCYRRRSLEVLSAPANGEYVNQTWFTTSRDTNKAVRTYRGSSEDISGFILMSDGAEAALYDGRRNKLASACIGLLYHTVKFPKSIINGMLEDSFRLSILPRTRDDCSIALLARSRFKHFKDYKPYLRRLEKRKHRREKSDASH